MKEQALPLIASKYDVRVMHRRRPTGLPVRSIARLRPGAAVPPPPQKRPARRHRSAGRGLEPDVLRSSKPGAIGRPSARVHDSVVLRGARVEAGAVLVRSVVCPGAVVARDRTAVDRLVAATAGGSKGLPPQEPVPAR